MTHIRTNIRQVFVDLLLDKTDAGSFVYNSRIYNLERSDLPAIIIFSDHEDVITDTIGFPRTQERSLKVTVQCYCRYIDKISDKIDDLCLQIEQIIMVSSNLNGACKDCRLESTDINLHNELEQPIAIATLIFNVVSRVQENQPSINKT